MDYERLKELMHEYRMERLGYIDMATAIALWQLKSFGKIA